MELNTLKPAKGSKKAARRLGRGFTRGKTCGRGHKGQKSRSGGSVSAAFEGGQMPLQRRLPKVGFSSKTNISHSEVKLYSIQSVINKQALKKPKIDLEFLKQHKIIKSNTSSVKIILAGKLESAITVCTCTKLIGKTEHDLIRVTAGAKQHIESLGGKVVATKVVAASEKESA